MVECWVVVEGLRVSQPVGAHGWWESRGLAGWAHWTIGVNNKLQVCQNEQTTAEANE